MQGIKSTGIESTVLFNNNIIGVPMTVSLHYLHLMSVFKKPYLYFMLIFVVKKVHPSVLKEKYISKGYSNYP